mmetsp:Transcript_42485/g.47983  ORF Transcript_42485/g.47983 Transcript_42485/m.47983 type:complete len:558 (-) Transcript_42485:126-1799(-)
MIRRSNYNITSSLSQENLQLLAPSQEQRVQDIEDDNQDDERSIAYDCRDEESDETHHHLHRSSPRLNINATTISSNNNVIFILSKGIVMNMWSTISGYMNSTRLIVLFVLCFQNSLFTVLRRYSQGVLKENYSKYELLLVAELIKILYSSWMISKNLKCASTSVSSSSSSPEEGGSTSSTIPIHKMSDPNKNNNNNNNNINKRRSKSLSKKLFYLLSTSRKMLVLASIYGVMNILSFVALRNISAGMFTIISQCKILTTATFSALILKRQYSWTKWRALITLLVGVLLFSESIWSEKLLISTSTSSNNQVLGTIAVLIEVVLSGFASIYFEKVIKTDPLQLGIWERNFQLAVGSFPVYVLFIIGNGGGTAGFFGGWSILTFILSILGAAGGLLVALSIKYGDSILKTLATTGAIVVTGVLDHVFLGGPLTPSMILTALQVIISICNYTFDATPTTPVSAATATATATTEESRSAKSTSTIMNNNVLLANDNNNNNSASSTTPTKMKVGRGGENDEKQQRQMNNSSSKNIEMESLLQRTRSPGLSETKNDTDNSILDP